MLRTTTISRLYTTQSCLLASLPFIKTFWIVLFFMGTLNLQGQTISFDNTVSPELTICQEAQTFTIAFTNDGPTALNNVQVNIVMPNGIQYETSSLTNIVGGQVSEQTISNPENITFSVSAISSGASISFDVDLKARFDAYTHHLSGGVFRNTVTVNYTGGSESNTTKAYNILYPALTITNVSPASASVFVGQTFVRSVTIVNGGYGKVSDFVLTDTYDSNLSLTSTDKGVLNAAGTAISFSASDFTSIGDGDAYFEQNESITIQQVLVAEGCNDTQSELQAVWSCDGQTIDSNIKYPYTQIQLFSPNVAVTASPTFNTCVDGSPDVQTLTLVNNGSGPANELTIDIMQQPEQVYSGIDPASIAYRIDNGASISITPSLTTSAYNHDCLSADKVGTFQIILPPLQPGETAEVTWNSYTCDTDACGDVYLIGWEYEVDYTDMCFKEDYEKDNIGQEEKRKNFTVFYESPSDLVDQQVGEYVFILSSATFDLPEGTNPYFELALDIPSGLVWSGNNDDLKYVSGAAEWAASEITYDESTGKLTAKYPFPIPVSLVRSEFRLNLSLDCSHPNVGGMATVGMQLFYIMDTNCANPYRMPLTCYQTPMTFLHCPGPCSEGLGFTSFNIERTNFGQSDNDRDGLPDANDALDFSKIKTNRVMMSDTFKTIFKGRIITSAAYPSWEYGYGRSRLPYGDKLKALSANVKITDSSTGVILTCDNVPFTTQLSGTTLTVEADFSAPTLAALGCSTFDGFVLEQDDEVELEIHYILVGNIGGNIEQVLVTNDFYVAPSANGKAFQCNDWSGNVTFVGYYFTTYKGEQYDITSCTQVIKQNYYLSVGTCCSNYAGGDFFPYEYRNWATVKDVRVVIPDGFSVTKAYMDYYRTKHVNATTLEQITDMQPDAMAGQEYTYDLEQYFTSQGGTLNLSDDGFNGTVFLEITPNCNAQNNTYLPVEWNYRYKEVEKLGGAITDEYSGHTDYIKYIKGNLKLSTTLQTTEGVAPTVSWEVTARNTSVTPTPNSWLNLQSPNSVLNILSVEEISSGAVLTPLNGFYQLGEFAGKEKRKYRITASSNNCSSAQLTTYIGYSCEGYPNNFAAVNCPFKEFPLYVVPQTSELQIRTTELYDPTDPCGPSFGVEIEMLSAKIAAVKDIVITVTAPNNQSITLVNGSTQAQYPLSNSFSTIGDPNLNGNVYTLTGADIASIIGTDGLVGLTDVTSNIARVRLNFQTAANFQPGDFLQFQVAAKRSCGDPLPTLALAYDPNAVFAEPTNIGLGTGGDNWAASWGDYNNDGNVDLFVTTYDLNKPNELFKNNGNGTFSKVTTGVIATDKASSLASSWADYDNDGDLDLYVANNIGLPNFLYRNEGGGSFIRLQNDPVVNDLGYGHGVSWADYDNDGFLDLFVTSFFSTQFNLLYHNNGDGTFSKAVTNAVTKEASSSTTGVWADYNNDGFIDLFVANTNGENNSLYENKGNGSFLKINGGAIVNDGGHSVGASWADYDNDGDLDLVVTNAANEKNFFYKNNGNSTFTKITSGAIVADERHSHGSSWADVDNDGWIDLFVANDQEQNNQLFRNNGDGTFTPLDNAITQAGGLSFGAAWADYDNDGGVDLFVANRGGADNFIYQNIKGGCQSKACVLLVGSNSNKSAIGAKVYVKATVYGQSITQMREISSQTGGGIGGQNDLKTIIGLGDAGIIDSIIVKWPSGYVQYLTNQMVDDCLVITEENASTVCGLVYHDENENCIQDEGELGIANQKLLLTPGNNVVFTDEAGRYEAFVPTGRYDIILESGTNWAASCASKQGVQEVEVREVGATYCDFNFGSIPTCSTPDLEVETAITSHRIGFENLIAITFKNTGTIAATNVMLGVNLDAYCIPLNSTIPWDKQDGQNLFWLFESLPAGTNQTIYLTDSVAATTPIGQELVIAATMSADEGDCNIANNAFKQSEEAIGALDPNDILVFPEGAIESDQELVYKIRFQNVGNIPVSLVRIESTLPKEIDKYTFELGVASHPYRFEQRGTDLFWEFPNINLPDSIHNEPESHGFVTFKVRPKADLSRGTIIKNDASIFFDNMEPIATNVVESIIQPFAPAAEAGQLVVYPNPTDGLLNIQLLPLDWKEPTMLRRIQLVNLQGVPVLSVENIEDMQQLDWDISSLATGVYFVKALDEEGVEYLRKLYLVGR